VLPKIKSNTNIKPSTVAYAYNPSYMGGREQRDHGLRPAETKSLRDPILTNKKLGVVGHTSNLTCAGSVIGRIEVQASLGKK
jgi:hypothetical protein